MPDNTPGAPAEKKRIKVAVVIGTLEVGGAELDIVRNFPRLNRDEFEVVVVCFGAPGALAPELERQGIRVVSRRPAAPVTDAGDDTVRGAEAVPSAGSSAWRADRGRVARLPRWLQRIVRPVFAALYMARVTVWVAGRLAAEKADVMHAFLPHSYAYGIVGCMLARPRAKTVMSRLSLNFYKDSHKPIAWLERALLHRRVDIAIGNSKQILAELAEEGVAPSKLRLLHNGIDPAPFARREGDRERAREALGIAPDAFAMVAVGNLHAYKGHADLLEACALAAPRFPRGWTLLIAGRDQQGNRAVLEALSAKLGLGGDVRLLGACEEVPQLLAAADVFVQPSHHEGLPNAIVEAMAASLPVVATDVGGIPEAVAGRAENEDDATGWLVPPRHPQALASALLDAAADPELRRVMGARAAERVHAEFSLERSVGAYESIYREIMS